MPTSTHLDDLKINVLTESQFDAAVQGGTIGAGEISMITDLDEAIQVDTMPTAAATELGKIYQFTGTTGAYTHGYFYECVSDGGNPATYSWSQTNVQPAPSGLPSQSGNNGKFLTTDGTDASWSDKPLVNTATNADAVSILGGATGIVGNVIIGKDATTSNTSNQNARDIIIGYKATSVGGNTVIGDWAKGLTQWNTVIGAGAEASGSASEALAVGVSAKITGNQATAVGCVSKALGNNSLAIGAHTECSGYGAIQLGRGSNSTAGTFSVGIFTSLNNVHNYRLLDSDGTIPTDRFTTTPVADGTYVPTLTISSGVATRTWAAPASGASSATGTLVAADWSSSSQTINVTGVTASNNVIVAAAPASQAAYTAAGVICTAQGAGTLTFTCTSTPSTDLTVNVLII